MIRGVKGRLARATRPGTVKSLRRKLHSLYRGRGQVARVLAYLRSHERHRVFDKNLGFDL